MKVYSFNRRFHLAAFEAVYAKIQFIDFTKAVKFQAGKRKGCEAPGCTRNECFKAPGCTRNEGREAPSCGRSEGCEVPC